MLGDMLLEQYAEWEAASIAWRARMEASDDVRARCTAHYARVRASR